MPVLHPDHLYKMPRMNKAFALSSIALLLVFLWMVVDDYYRPWKVYQAQFIRLDVAKTNEAIAAADAEVDAAKAEELKKALDDAQKEVDAKQAQLDAASLELAQANVELYSIDQNFRFKKAEIDTMKYDLDEAHSHNKASLAKVQGKFDEGSKILEERRQILLNHKVKIDGIQARITEITKNRDAAQLAYDTLYTARTRNERKLAKISPDWRRLLLNLPMMDMVAPTLKVRQVVVNDLKNDVNFLKIPRVDRCMTCHVGIAQKGYEDAAEPFTTHPNLEIYVGDSSKHPMGSFGCTTCHYGQDRATSFILADHTPSTPEQAEEWEHKYGWEPIEDWDEPMLPKQHIEAACRKCHMDEVRVPQGTHINRSVQLVERYGCYNCHKIQGWEKLPKSGPDLRAIAGKVPPQWTLKWLKDPRAFRPSTRMPQFWDLTNTKSPEDLVRNNVEADAIVTWLYENSERPTFPKPPVAGVASRGEQLVNQAGCKGCHQAGADDPVVNRGSLRQFGPELNQIGSKMDSGWLFAWIKNPAAVMPTTRMPNLRLTDQEAADIVAYLMTLKNESFDSAPVPTADAAMRDKIVLEYLSAKLTATEAQAKLAAMPESEKKLYLGDKFINRYGCFGCHLMKGFETTPGIGTELTTWASKYVDQLDYGLLEQQETEPEKTVDIEGWGSFDKVARTKQAWAFQKLKNPRIYDVGRYKKPDEKLKMPDFGLSDEDANAIVTALLSFTKEKVSPTMTHQLTPAQAEVQAGRRIVTNRNCEGCHVLYGEGGEIQPTIAAALVRYDGRSADDADTQKAIFSPPLLDGEGSKVKPDWFFNFLKAPSTIRPWLKVRMPSFGLSDDDANAIITHLARKDGAQYPFHTYSADNYGPREKEAALKMFSKDYFNCWTCHQQGDKKPLSPIDSWAPDLTLARARLQSDWIVKWLQDPSKIQPGTKMPTFYDPADPKSSAPPDVLDGDPAKQMTAIRDYIYSIGSDKK